MGGDTDSQPGEPSDLAALLPSAREEWGKQRKGPS